jgi:hypothetical protein
MPRVRLTLGRMMLVVAALALVSWGARRYHQHREVTWWVTRGNPNLLSKCTLSTVPARWAMLPDRTIIEGQEIPVDVAYDFVMTSPVPPPGLDYLVPLTTGAREHTSGKFTWRPKAPRPGTYMLAHSVRYRNPLGEWRGLRGGAARVTVMPRHSSLTHPPRLLRSCPCC